MSTPAAGERPPVTRKLQAAMPWWVKIGAKIALARLPVEYGFWQRIGLFRHGYMDEATYAQDVFLSHVVCGGLREQVEGALVVELGPGDSLATAVVAASFGARCILVDTGPYALDKIPFYQDLANQLRENGLEAPDLSKARTLTDILDSCNSKYLTNGIESLRSIEAASVDLVFSQAVLEHVRQQEFEATIRATRKILKHSGVASHTVDLKDHLGGALNNLRFSHYRWESKLFADSGFYTNRIRYSEMLSIFRRSGFEVDVINSEAWSTLPTPRSKLNGKFDSLADDDLKVATFQVILSPV